MRAIPPLETLGQRIWITGPAAGGKSTLARAIGSKLGLPVVHLDRLRFVPHSNWVLRPDATFEADATAAAAAPRWIIEGNYFSFAPSRFERATGLISLSTPRFGNFLRYLQRSLGSAARTGSVEGAADRPSWPMIRWILWQEPRRRGRKRQRLRATGRPLVETDSLADLRRLYDAWDLPPVTPHRA